jgi:hypothetical protein
MFLPGDSYKHPVYPNNYMTVTEFDATPQGYADSVLVHYHWDDHDYEHYDTQRNLKTEGFYAYNPAGDHLETPTRN